MPTQCYNGPAISGAEQPYLSLPGSSAKKDFRLWSWLKNRGTDIGFKEIGTLAQRAGKAAKRLFWENAYFTGGIALVGSGGVVASAIVGNSIGTCVSAIGVGFFGQRWLSHPNPVQSLENLQDQKGLLAKCQKIIEHSRLLGLNGERFFAYEVYTLAGFTLQFEPEIGTPLCLGLAAMSLAIQIDQWIGVSEVLSRFREVYTNVNWQAWRKKHKASLVLGILSIPGNIIPYLMTTASKEINIALDASKKLSPLLLGRAAAKIAFYKVRKTQAKLAENQSLLRGALSTVSWMAKNAGLLIAGFYAISRYTGGYVEGSSFFVGFCQGLYEECSEERQATLREERSGDIEQGVSSLISCGQSVDLRSDDVGVGRLLETKEVSLFSTDKTQPSTLSNRYIAACEKGGKISRESLISIATITLSLAGATYATQNEVCSCIVPLIITATEAGVYSILKLARYCSRQPAKNTSRLVNQVAEGIIDLAKYSQLRDLTTIPLLISTMPYIPPMYVMGIVGKILATYRFNLDDGIVNAQDNPHPGVHMPKSVVRRRRLEVIEPAPVAIV